MHESVYLKTKDIAEDCNVDMHTKKRQGTLNGITSVCMYPSISCSSTPHYSFHEKENTTPKRGKL
jgi:hypothetical protein